MFPLIIIGAAALLLSSSKSSRRTALPCPVLTTGKGRLAGYDYIEIVTGGASLSDRLPIIILLHGRGAQPESISKYLENISVRSRVVIPSGNLGTSSSPLWFDLRAAASDQDTLASQMKEEANRVANFIREANRCLKGVGKPVVTGHSQGGMLSLAIAATNPALPREVIAVSAWLPISLWPNTLPVTHLIHGMNDTTVDYSRTADFVARAKGAGLPIDITSIAGRGHGMGGDMEVKWIELVDRAIGN